MSILKFCTALLIPEMNQGYSWSHCDGQKIFMPSLVVHNFFKIYHDRKMILIQVTWNYTLEFHLIFIIDCCDFSRYSSKIMNAIALSSCRCWKSLRSYINFQYAIFVSCPFSCFQVMLVCIALLCLEFYWSILNSFLVKTL